MGLGKRPSLTPRQTVALLTPPRIRASSVTPIRSLLAIMVRLQTVRDGAVVCAVAKVDRFHCLDRSQVARPLASLATFPYHAIARWPTNACVSQEVAVRDNHQITARPFSATPVKHVRDSRRG